MKLHFMQNIRLYIVSSKMFFLDAHNYWCLWWSHSMFLYEMKMFSSFCQDMVINEWKHDQWHCKIPVYSAKTQNKLHHERICLQGLQLSVTQIMLYSHRRQLEAFPLGFKKKRDCTIYVVKKVLIRCTFALHTQKSGFLTMLLK